MTLPIPFGFLTPTGRSPEFHYLERTNEDGMPVYTADQMRAYAAAAVAAEREETLAEFAALLPGPYYMDPPDGGNVTVLEQFQRMAEDARRWREHQEHARLAVACELRCEG